MHQNPNLSTTRSAFFLSHHFIYHYFPGDSDGKVSAYNTGDPGSILGSGRSPGEGKGYPLQYSWLEESLDKGAWPAIYSLWGHKELDTTE